MQRRHWIFGSAAAVLAPAFVRDARAGADVPRFTLGVASGQPSERGVVLWTRLVGPGLPAQVSVRWEVAHDERFERIAEAGEETASAQDAHSVHAEPSRLEPGRVYWYRFQALKQSSTPARTRTAPAAADVVARLDFVIASCQRRDHGSFDAWRHAATEELDLVLFLGDYIYEYALHGPRGDGSGHLRTLADYRARHALHKSDAALQAAHAACPWLLVWDDHEVENDHAGWQGGHGPDPGFAARRRAAYQAYWEHMPLPKSARPDGGGEMRMFHRLDWGRLARVHCVDDRQWRDPQACPRPDGGTRNVRPQACAPLADPRRSLLGAAQEQWLADGWDLSRPWNLLAQQTAMCRLTSRGGERWTDGWDGYEPARNRLLGTVARKQVPGVVVLGGDVHANIVSDLRPDFDDARAPVVASEFCGTSITSTRKPGLEALMNVHPHLKHVDTQHRGYMRFTLKPGRLDVALRTLEDATVDRSALRTQHAFVVDAKRAGPQSVS
jgi:alkaline phosphatase D